MRQLAFRIFLSALFIQVATAQAFAAKRVALVIGNDAYQQVSRLRKAVNDARAIGKTLEAIGFKVLRAENLTRRGMNRQIQLFASQLRIGDEALFFFAGHGVEINGRNYLLPTDIPKVAPGQEGFVTTEAIAVDRVLDRIRERGTRVSILVLDACRDNPFPRAGTRSLGGTRGLARMPAPEGTFIMYSAGVGQTALDRLKDKDPHPNSVFTRSLIPLLKAPGLSLTATARRVRRDVQKLARSVSHDQRPAYYDEVTGEFFFAGRGDARNATAPKEPAGRFSPAAQAWSLIKDTKTVGDLEAFIEEYPASFYAKLAKSRLAKLKERKVAIVRPPKPVSPSKPKPTGAPVHDCDRLAAWPDDPAKVTEGVAFTAIRAEAAIRACRQAVDADPGVVRFAFQLGRALLKDGSYGEARRWLRKAAEKGHAGAMNNLGVMYGHGQGVGKDERQAVRWYRKAAAKGIGPAMNNLGSMYAGGQGVDKDERQAVRWYRKAAEKGAGPAMYSLGLAYGNGRGVDKDDRQAVRWYRRAAEKGIGQAMNYLALSYDLGRGVDKNQREAMRWHRRAAEKGIGQAMYNLGVMYIQGRGVSKDSRTAAAWVFKALRAGDDYAVKEMTSKAKPWSEPFRRELQRLMKEEGVYSGPLDGHFGESTTRAIKALAKT